MNSGIANSGFVKKNRCKYRGCWEVIVAPTFVTRNPVLNLEYITSNMPNQVLAVNGASSHLFDRWNNLRGTFQRLLKPKSGHGNYKGGKNTVILSFPPIDIRKRERQHLLFSWQGRTHARTSHDHRSHMRTPSSSKHSDIRCLHTSTACSQHHDTTTLEAIAIQARRHSVCTCRCRILNSN